MLSMNRGDSVPEWLGGGREFRTTQWAQVHQAAEHPAPTAQEALAALCRDYWAPLYAYLRRTGHPPHDAQDLVQGFFAALIAGGDLQAAEPARGRFRSFLLGALKHHLQDERKRALALKRGGRVPRLSLEELPEAAEPAGVMPDSQREAAYDHDWAQAVIVRALAAVREEYTQRGQGEVFKALQPCLGSPRPLPPYAELAGWLGLGEGGVKTAVHRLRRAFGVRLRAEVAATLANPAEVDAELRHLMVAAGKPPGTECNPGPETSQ
ncbi:MAG: sigma-70 family RNA polymerase sigma factor [Verrucomicrobiae bacterium]|nr:sigma-70 family RNA polymerase sigma factor [Verrucomicrobiae bacterium]